MNVAQLKMWNRLKEILHRLEFNAYEVAPDTEPKDTEEMCERLEAGVNALIDVAARAVDEAMWTDLAEATSQKTVTGRVQGGPSIIQITKNPETPTPLRPEQFVPMEIDMGEKEMICSLLGVSLRASTTEIQRFTFEAECPNFRVVMNEIGPILIDLLNDPQKFEIAVRPEHKAPKQSVPLLVNEEATVGYARRGVGDPLKIGQVEFVEFEGSFHARMYNGITNKECDWFEGPEIGPGEKRNMKFVAVVLLRLRLLAAGHDPERLGIWLKTPDGTNHCTFRSMFVEGMVDWEHLKEWVDAWNSGWVDAWNSGTPWSRIFPTLHSWIGFDYKEKQLWDRDASALRKQLEEERDSV